MVTKVFQEMKGKVALVTVATSGIGRASALLLAGQGIKVILAGRNEQSGKLLEKEISALNRKAVFVKTDVSSAESVKNLIALVKSSFGTVHYALNCAGIEGKLGSLAEMEEQDFDEEMLINLKGVWLCLKHQLHLMAWGSKYFHKSYVFRNCRYRGLYG
ncbi:MAG: SDR family NAD(P)-dependent oxidoreductase [Chlamydiia bacterium]|nr:SDR family NAD(P)-dependent oxidoreductase [Chlamydiia bacterium]